MSDALVSYAALILADAEKEITSENLQTILSAAGASVDSIWTSVFAKALEGKDLKDILFSMAAAAPAAGAAGAASAGASEEAAAEQEEEAAEESDDDMGFGLFD
ncbi:ribosomal protein P1B [Martiniozyma asiatica (nom. inval.)]|nr:ribosomal protein P1B [Martiniozyma asiatica]